jgi:hypothetical protein
MKLGRDGGITQSGKSGIRRTIIGIDGSKRSVCISFSRGGPCWTFEQAWVSCRQYLIEPRVCMVVSSVPPFSFSLNGDST